MRSRKQEQPTTKRLKTKPKGDKYYEWQDDKYSRIGFSAIPDIENKVINKNVMTADEIKVAKKKPLVLINHLKPYSDGVWKCVRLIKIFVQLY